jgi:uncharacterized protein YbjT (DUF2867 family)
MLSNNKELIAVIGATGHQGGGVVRALQASGEFKVRALARNPDKHRQLADEVVKADLDRPETLEAALNGAYGVFLASNFREKGDFLSFKEIVETLNQQGHNLSYKKVR